MRTIAIMNNKGGVGKTVTAINLADILVRDYRQRVILADCDGQMNLTRFFVPDFDPEAEYTMVSLLEGDGEALWSDNLLQVSKDLWLIPGSPELYTEDLEAVMEGQDQVKTRRVANFVDCAREATGRTSSSSTARRASRRPAWRRCWPATRWSSPWSWMASPSPAW